MDHLRPSGDGSFLSDPSKDGGLARGLLKLMNSRRQETEDLLRKRKGILVCKLRNPGRPLTILRRESDEKVDEYSWLPSVNEKDLLHEQNLQKGEGERLDLVRSSSPLTNFLRTYVEDISYEAVIKESNWRSRGNIEVLARTSAGDIAAFGLELDGGQIYFLPSKMTFDVSTREEFLELFKNFLGGRSPFLGPSWLDNYLLSDEKAVQADISELEDKIIDLEEARAEKQKELNSLSSFRKLLSAGSEFELKKALWVALERLDLKLEEGRAGVDIRLTSPDGSEFAVKVGAERDRPVGLGPYHELVRGINDLKIYENDDPQGVLVINGYANTDPENRSDQVRKELEEGCNLYGFKLVSTIDLYEQIKRVEDRERRTELLVKSFREG